MVTKFELSLFLDSIIHCLISLKEQNKEILSILRTIQEKVFGADGNNNDNSFNLPVTSLDGLDSLENSLDEENIKKLVRVLTKNNL